MLRRSRGGFSVASKPCRCVNNAALGAWHSTVKQVLFDYYFKVKGSLLLLAQPYKKSLLLLLQLVEKVSARVTRTSWQLKTHHGLYYHQQAAL